MITHITDQWQGCYPSNWKGLIVPDAMAHPAKYSSWIGLEETPAAREEA